MLASGFPCSIAKRSSKYRFQGVPMDSPRGAEQRAVVDPHHEPTARRLARFRAICAGPARCEHRRKQANRWGRLFFGDFLLAKQKKVTATRGMSALVAPATRVRNATIPLSPTLSHEGRGDKLRSWFDRLTTNGATSPTFSMRPNSGARRVIPPAATTTHPHPRR